MYGIIREIIEQHPRGKGGSKMQEPLVDAGQSVQLITLTMGQLQDLISQAVQEAIEPLVARIQGPHRQAGILEETTARERAYDMQRIAKLESVDPQPLQKDRGAQGIEHFYLAVIRVSPIQFVQSMLVHLSTSSPSLDSTQ
jgi:hypothetical protein